MNLLKLLALLIATCAYTTNAQAHDEAKSPAIQSTTGTFTGIEQGDYAYFQLHGDDGEDRSLMILQTDASLEHFIDQADKLIGTHVRVRWQERTENIPEAGGDMAVQVALSVEILPPSQ